MSRYKVYEYVLGTLYVIDTQNKEHGTASLNMNTGLNELRDTKRITKATINKYRRDYEKNSFDTYVITSPMLASMSDDPSEREKHFQKSARKYIGSFDTYNDLQNEFKELYIKTKDVRKKYHFVNFGSSLLEIMQAIKEDKTYNNWNEKDWALYNILK